ncbi:inactive pancreatic lipase-related protein 1-like [Anneissia japonica]|uniref:inactive pancreatic lipase-related protein 1-like n=1 Tax=Anneissia japonica TaxID=1529436 RepID=UPI001425925F|nr:inactive pancreatic lipase-related protein 1-like [Anneissia japonica]
MENGLVGWMEDMMTEFINNGDYNVIRVDWGKGSTATYGQATANTRIVGAEISFLIDKFKELYGYTADKVHIIGHSLGSHVAGYAGERQTKPKLGRITGMDPAGPYFEDTDIIVRLDPSDATFVDAIHTDTDPIYNIGYGIFMQVGHMDFYVNGGTDQPGCDQGLVGNIITSGGIYDGGVQYVACNHVRSYEYFTESINSKCKFTSYDCTNYGQGEKGYEAYKNGQCFDNNGVEMGFHSIDSWSMSSASDTVYFVNTKDSSPYCGLQYRFQMYVDDPGWLSGSKEKGDLFVYLVGNRGTTGKIPLTTHSQYFEPKQDYGFVGVAETDPGRLTGMYMEWSYDPDWYKPWDWDVWTNPEIYVHKFDVESSEEKRGYLMCGDDSEIVAEKDKKAYLVTSGCS